MIEVHDDGRGFDPAAVGPDHFGLRSMRGRVADLGGRFEITSAPGQGTVLRVESVEGGPGDFILIPKGVVHREGNPGTEPNEAIVVRVGEGEVLVNVDGP